LLAVRHVATITGRCGNGPPAVSRACPRRPGELGQGRGTGWAGGTPRPGNPGATRRSPGLPNDDEDMSEQPVGPAVVGARLLALYDHALPQVYGYLLARCGQRAVAEDLTAETFLAAVDAVRAGPGAPVSTAWLVGVARHKLSDHWRRQAREQRALHAVAAEPGSPA